MEFILIDDDPITLFLAKHIFLNEDYSDNVIEFNDPERALDFLRHQISDGQVPQVIILDLNMPKISGWDLLVEL